MDFKLGTQIMYVPLHADGDVTHKDVEKGFVTSVRDDGTIAWCRFWYRGKEGVDMRTTSCSESVPTKFLQPHVSVPQGLVDGLLVALDESEDAFYDRLAEEALTNQCPDCGGIGKHFDDCEPGSSERWTNFYNEADDDGILSKG